MEAITGMVRPDWLCLDIGANIGVYSLLLSGLAQHVYAFEPSPTNADLIAASLGLNSVANVSIERLALGDTTEDRQLSHFTEVPGCSFIEQPTDDDEALQRFWGVHLERTSYPVHVSTLDKWASQKRLPRLDFIKMDIEGFEPKALDGAVRTIRHYRPVLVIEFNTKALSHYFETPKVLYDSLAALFQDISIIGGDKVRSYEDLAAHLTPQRFWTDLLCRVNK